MSEKVSSKTPKERIMDRVYEKSHVSTVSEYGITENEVNTKVVSEAIDEEFEGLVAALDSLVLDENEYDSIEKRVGVYHFIRTYLKSRLLGHEEVC